VFRHDLGIRKQAAHLTFDTPHPGELRALGSTKCWTLHFYYVIPHASAMLFSCLLLLLLPPG
jgi:hypothetical protein